VGQKIPVANDGSNYYQARQYNDPYDRDTGNPCEEIGSSNSYISQGSLYTIVSQPKFGKDTFVAADSGFGTNSNNWQSIITTTTASVWPEAFTLEARLGEPTTWVAADGRALTLEQQQALQEAYTRVPDHEFESNFWGQCERCPTHNIYRREMNAHLFVIQEERSAEDWLLELAS
jgi:hypothetical protein